MLNYRAISDATLSWLHNVRHLILVSIAFPAGGGAIVDALKARGGAIVDALKARGGAIVDAPKSRGGAIVDAPKAGEGAIFDAYHLDFMSQNAKIYT